MGIPVTVTVDDYLPFWASSWSGTDLIFAKKSSDGALWAPILEKAAAKLFGNYEILEAGNMGPAIQTLTGSPYYNYPHTDYSVNALWEFVNEKFNQGWMITVGTPYGNGSDKDSNELGIAFRHAFTVNGTVQLSNG